MKNPLLIISLSAATLLIAGGLWMLMSDKSPATQETNSNVAPTQNYQGTSDTAISAQENRVETVKISSRESIGQYLTDAVGMSLYYYTRDTVGKSNCSGGCLVAWPAFYSEQINVEPPLDQKNFGNIVRPDGKEQTTYKNLPLYYYIEDKRAGDIVGQGVGGVWFLVKP